MRSSTTSCRSKPVWFAALALALVLPTSAHGQGATNPTFTRIQQGSLFDGVVVTCETSSTTLLNCPANSLAGAGDWRAVTCLNDGANKVYLCPGHQSNGNCNTCVAGTNGFIALEAKGSFTFGASAKGLGLSCIATGGTTTVRCYAER